MPPKAKILIIDDDATIASVCERGLNLAGHDAMYVGSGEEALDVLKTKRFHMAIVDLQLPGMSGIELMKHIRSVQPDCDLIIITAYASVDSAIESLRLGVYDYIKKPFSINLLRDKVAECFKGRIDRDNIREKDEMINLYQICKSCKVSKITVDNWVEQGMFSHYRSAEGQERIKIDDFNKFVEKYKIECIPLEISRQN